MSPVRAAGEKPKLKPELFTKVKLPKKQLVSTLKEKEKGPKSPEGGKKRAKKISAVARKIGKKNIEKVKKAKPVVILIFGKKVLRKKVGGKFVFIEAGSKAKIGDLTKWALDKAKDKTAQARAEKNLKPYNDKLKATTPEQRTKALAQLNKMKVHKFQNGADTTGAIKGDAVARAALRSQAVLDKKGSTYKVTDSVNKLKHKAYLDYSNTLPPNVKTIVVTRNGKRMLCRRVISRKGGRVIYENVGTGERVSMKKGDSFRIVGSISKESALYKQTVQKENQWATKRMKLGYAWDKDKEKPVKVSQGTQVTTRYTGGGYGGGRRRSYGGSGGGGGGGAPAYRPPSGGVTTVAKGPAPKPLAPTATLDQTPEELRQKATQHTFEIPGARYMFASMLLPKKKLPGKPKLLLYFAGSGQYDSILKYYKTHGRGKKPPLDVLAKAAREDFLSKKKHLSATLAERWAKGENVCLVLVSHMRPYLHPTHSKNSKHWYNELRKRSSAENVIGTIQSQYKMKTGFDAPNDIHLSGHSMGGKALAGLAKLKSKGKINYNFSYFFSDASYWYFPTDEIERNKKTSLYLSFRPGTSTAKIAKYLISKLRLKGQKRGNEVVFANPEYPNVRVIQTRAGHSSHPGRYFASGWELAKKFRKKPSVGKPVKGAKHVA